MAPMESSDLNRSEEPPPDGEDEHIEEEFKLPSLMQSLTQQLQDRIYDLTFTAAPGVRFIGHIHRYNDNDDTDEQRYSSAANFFATTSLRNSTVSVSHGVGKCCLFTKPDSIQLLHVDRASRQKFAASFFGGADVYFMCDDDFEMAAFLSSLDPAHAALIHDIRSSDLCEYVPAFVAARYTLMDAIER